MSIDPIQNPSPTRLVSVTQLKGLQRTIRAALSLAVLTIGLQALTLIHMLGLVWKFDP